MDRLGYDHYGVQGGDSHSAFSAGATDTEIHDTVLIAAMFCMLDRYVDGLGTVAPDHPALYAMQAQDIVAHGYRLPAPAVAGSLLVTGGRELLALAPDQQLVLVFFPLNLGPLFLVFLGVADVGVQRRGIGGGRHVVRVEGVDPRFHALIFRLVGQPVVIEMLRRATVLAAIAAESLVWTLECHGASRTPARRTLLVHAIPSG